MSSFDKQFGNISSNERSFVEDPYIDFELDGKYRILELIGSGGWGNVYIGRHMQLGTALAIKVVHKHHMQNEQSIKRFELESKLLSRLESPYTVKIIDHGFSPAPYIVMEYFDGKPLNKWLRDNGAMNSQIAIEFFMQLCDGLAAAQAIKIVHRDLKPANILLKISSGNIQAKILDFGLAKFIDSSAGGDKLTSTGDVLGSPPYMSPEQWKGQADHRSDIYSLGCIMYEVLAGKPAYTADYGLDYLNKHLNEKPKKLSEVNPSEKVPAALEAIVNKCLQKMPANRYQTAAACKADLRKLKTGRTPLIILNEEMKLGHLKWVLVAVLS
jgi:serine/threonine protein kinase